METFPGKIVSTPFAVNHMTTGTRRHITGGMEQRSGHVRAYIRIGGRVGVAVSLPAERLVFEISPCQFSVRVKYEIRTCDVINELFGIIEVRSPGDVPGDCVRSGAHRHCRPVYRRIPGSGATLPGFAVEAADIRGIFYHLAALCVAQHAHKGIAGRGIADAVEGCVTDRSIRAFTPGGHIGLGLHTAQLIARFWTLHKTVTVCAQREPGQEQAEKNILA
jgi:hypothetical protein